MLSETIVHICLPYDPLHVHNERAIIQSLRLGLCNGCYLRSKRSGHSLQVARGPVSEYFSLSVVVVVKLAKEMDQSERSQCKESMSIFFGNSGQPFSHSRLLMQCEFDLFSFQRSFYPFGKTSNTPFLNSRNSAYKASSQFK